MAVDVLISGVAYVGLTDSLQITEQARATASTSIQVRLDALPTPVSLQSVQILIDDVPVFAGLIETVSTPEYDTGFETRVVTLSIQSLESILSRRLITRNWYGKYVHEIVADIFTEYLAEEGLALGSISTTTIQIDAYKKSYEQASTVLNELAKKVDGASFYIAPDKKFYFLVASDFPQVDAPEHITGLKKVDAYSDLRTVQIMKGASSRIIGTAENATLKAEIAALSGTSGKIEKIESDSTIRNPTAAGAEATERVAQYAEREITLTCTCHDLVKTALYQTWAITSGHFPTGRLLPTGEAIPGALSRYPLDMTGLYTVVQRTISCFGDQYKIAVTLKNRNYFARYGYSIRQALEDAQRAAMSILDIHSQDALTPNKKIADRAKWNAIAAEKDLLDEQADTYAITDKKATYDAAFQALADYLNGGTAWVSGYPLWLSGDELATTEDIDSTEYEGKWSDYDAGKADLSTSITAAVQAAAITESLQQVPTYTPQYLGAKRDAIPTGGREGDVYLLYSETPNTTIPPTIANPPDHRGVFRYTSGAWVWTTDPADMYKAIRDIADVCKILASDGTTPLYGIEADYGVDASIETAHISLALIDFLRGGSASFSGDVDMKNGTVRGVLNTPVMATTDPTTGATVPTPTPTYWAGSALISHCAGLSNGWHAATGTFGGKNVTHVVKGGADNSVSYQSEDAEVATSGTDWTTVKSFTAQETGKVKVFAKGRTYYYLLTHGNVGYWQILVNGIVMASISGYSIAAQELFNKEIIVADGDTVLIQSKSSYSGRNVWTSYARICPAENTIGVWNDSDNTATVIDSGYFNLAGNVHESTLADFVTSAIDDYWRGIDFINAFDGKVRGSIEQAVASSSAYGGKTVVSVYITGDASIRLTFSDTTTATIYAADFLTAAGSITLATTTGKMTLRRALTDLGYHIYADLIPGTSDEQIIVQNQVTGQEFSIMTLRAPVGATTEATHSQSCIVANSGQYIDWVHDISMHNYAGVDAVKVVDVIMCLNAALKGKWEWYRRKCVDGTAYGTYGTMEADFLAMSLSGDGLLHTPGGMTTDGPEAARTAGDNIFAKSFEVAVVSSGSWADKLQYKIKKSGTIRVYFTITANVAAGSFSNTVYGRVLVDGSAVGATASATASSSAEDAATASWIGYRDVTVVSGSIIKIQAYESNTAQGTASASNMKLGSAEEGFAYGYGG
jgi:hypothetical protein